MDLKTDMQFPPSAAYDLGFYVCVLSDVSTGMSLNEHAGRIDAMESVTQ